MSIGDVTQVTGSALFLILKVSIPILMISLIVGLIISIFQTVTSIQEQTLTFVPKVICTFLGIVILGNWMATNITDFMISLWSDFSRYIH